MGIMEDKIRSSLYDDVYSAFYVFVCYCYETGAFQGT